jgi:hypothetical protein
MEIVGRRRLASLQEILPNDGLENLIEHEIVKVEA